MRRSGQNDSDKIQYQNAEAYGSVVSGLMAFVGRLDGLMHEERGAYARGH
jgi:hypothetical protein